MVKQLLGHKSLSTTVGYLHISRPTMAQIKNPLDGMNWAPAPNAGL